MNKLISTMMSALLLVVFDVKARQDNDAKFIHAYRPDRILIQPRADTSEVELGNFHKRQQIRVLKKFQQIHGLEVLEVPAGKPVEQLISKYEQSGLVEFAEPDYLVYPAAAPNDPKFLDGTLWALNNYGQNGGTAHADISATNGWDVLNSASNIIVAVLDSGIRATHEDLASNMWVNPLDGGHGFNAFTGTNNPNDDSTSHGTMVAGILGAVGNNGKGVTGTAWQVQIMSCKCLDNGSGSDSTVIACIDYARTNGARIINASLDSPTFSLALSNAIVTAKNAGIIFVASAGNGTSAGRNVDSSPSYPACYKISNIVSVAYTTRNDTFGGLSNYGVTNVMLAAPGDQICSTFASSDTAYDPIYSFRAGTSFAAPFVSGACALLMAQYPADTYQDTIARLQGATDPLPSLAGKCSTGGRLNLNKILHTVRVSSVGANTLPFTVRVSGGLNRTCVVLSSTNLTNWSPVFTNSTGTNGTFELTDFQSTNVPVQIYRASANP